MPVNSREGKLCCVYQFTPVANDWELSLATVDALYAQQSEPTFLVSGWALDGVEN
jgi:hypothetical protein